MRLQHIANLFALVGIVSALPGNVKPSAPRGNTKKQPRGRTYDYIIAGGGLSGLVVANRLTEDPRVRVLVIEYGGFDDSDLARIPYLAAQLNLASFIPTLSAPDPELNNASFPVFLGGVVGGGSAVNGLAYNRGAAEDYNAWERLGNRGWNFDELLPYFRKSTTFQEPSPAAAEEFGLTYHLDAYGDGPVKPALTSFQFPDLKKFWQGWKDQNIPTPTEHGLGDAVGAFWMSSTINVPDGIRSDARREYYDPAASRSNLELMTNTVVDEVLFRGRLTADGVSFTPRGTNATRYTTRAYARREVILAAGAINTPKILQASGIGPRAVLEAAKIPVKLDLPAVGANFQDHPVAFLSFNLSNQAFPNGASLATDPEFNATALAEYEANRTGIYAVARGNGVAFLSLPQLTSPAFAESLSSRVSAQNASSFLPAAYSDPGLLAGFLQQREILTERFRDNSTAVAEYPFSGGDGAAVSALQKPLSRGTITLNPADPKGQPIVQYNTLQNPLDGDIMVAIVRKIRAFFASDALASLEPLETVPGPQVRTDEELLGALKRGLLNPSFAHPVGTCAMMPRDLGGCVDDELRVYGTKRLRIVDSSIIPLIPGAHMQATQYGVAEKAADLIQGRK